MIGALRRDTFWSRVTWVLHRASGLGVLLFLVVHVGDTALVRLAPRAYDGAIGVYRSAAVRPLELLLMGAVLFHAFNGLRLTIQDFWGGWLPYERVMLSATYALTVAAWLGSAYFVATR
jgi:succinate dehydrogenase / fumarate reductase cytochrome b subunit